MIIDKLFEEVKNNVPVCLGLDTSLDYVPEKMRKSFENEIDSIFEFNKQIIDETLDVVGCYKVQIAYYEAYGLKGLEVYSKTLKYIKEKNKIAIADIKRGDIADTAKMYAKAHFSGDFEADFVTLAPYMGLDSLEPYMPYVENNEKGIIVLCKTSNKGSADLQKLTLDNGEKIYQLMGKALNDLSLKTKGECGFGSVLAVVGCTNSEEINDIRKIMPDTFLLVPGYGAQGGTAKDVAGLFKNGNGAVVNSSRGIILAYRKVENGEDNIGKCAREASIIMRDDILNELARRELKTGNLKLSDKPDKVTEY